jgi:hypothetical protein
VQNKRVGAEHDGGFGHMLPAGQSSRPHPYARRPRHGKSPKPGATPKARSLAQWHHSQHFSAISRNQQGQARPSAAPRKFPCTVVRKRKPGTRGPRTCRRPTPPPTRTDGPDLRKRTAWVLRSVRAGGSCVFSLAGPLHSTVCVVTQSSHSSSTFPLPARHHLVRPLRP